MTSLTTTHSQFQQLWQHLLTQWQALGPQWADSVRRQFEQDHWQPVHNQLTATLQELGQLSDLITQARQSVP